MFKFEKLEVWKRAMALYQDIASISRLLDPRDQYSLGEQIRKAALSVSTNIAEGTGREGEKESKHFFNIAKGSVYEVVSLLYAMKSQNYLPDDKFNSVYAQCDEIARMITGLINK